MRLTHRTVFAALGLLAAASTASAASPASSSTSQASTEQVTVRLIAHATSVQPGQTLRVGVHQRIAAHWHTYWINPGDSGLPTTIEWSLPPGATAGPIQWPVPARYSVGPVTNYGFADEATLPAVLQVPSTLRDGEVFEIRAKVDWLVCRDECIPQQATLSLALPVRAAPAPASPDIGLLQKAEAGLPAVGTSQPAWKLDGKQLRLELPGANTLPAHDGAYFYARTWGQVAHAEPQKLVRDGARWTLQVPAGDTPPKAGDAVDGVLVLEREKRAVQAYAYGHDPAPGAPVEGTAPANAQGATPTAPTETPPSFAIALALALLGGIVLNLMPCVFPVLTIKALSLMRSAQSSRREMRLHGLAYAAGVLASFLALGGVLIALKAGGDSAGWGFQFQSPAFVLLMALLMFGVGLSLSGVVTLGASITGAGSSLAERKGWRGSFFTGVLATVVATPCTAPFMGAAVGYALAQPAAVTLAVFAALGTGLALPYLLLSEWPALQRLLPRPGAWMERLKQAMAFPMYASAAWLAWVLTQQAGTPALAIALSGAVALAFAAWLHGTTRTLGDIGQRRGALAAFALALLAAISSAWTISAMDSSASADAKAATRDGWEPYSPERLQALRAQGKPVFVNLTADWCITCIVNERAALHTARVEAAFSQAGIVRLKGDWTRRDERITQLLSQHGRSGVPLYLFYPANATGAPTVLPQLLTPDTVLSAVGVSR